MCRLKVFVLLILFFTKICDEVDGVCTLSLRNDFGSPSPVYLHNGDFLAPTNTSGDITLRRSETVHVACPGNNKFIVLGKNNTNINVFVVKCVKDQMFQGTKTTWVGNFSEIKCNAPPWFTTEEIGDCYDGYKLYKVGYEVENVFYSMYEACFNKYLLHTAYVKHQIHPKYVYSQSGGRRPGFIEGDLFGKTKMNKLYTTENQKKRVKEIFGSGKADQYITKNQYLNRGHLAPRGDFPLRAQQRASFHYINAAPQWMRGNAGDWAALEDAVRRRAIRSETLLHVYTGTLGVTTLSDETSTDKDFYLDVDENNNGILPVPLYFFKVIYDPKEKTAAAFVSINSSYYNRTMTDKLTFCNDICEQNSNYSWLKWRSNDGTHSFCCTYEEFVNKFDVLPKLKVQGLFF
ncbi:uncharacterized protein LOC124541547 [Vanessa cardui]|uniref:uncharacterized protein LOC124541547 n=1 Tax=Vanessa cardui TaxID=171605 RepID=UPI001F142587|nr:uncharacterized protein LOC124541547 [Vanessa cardui]